jgi:hypothetical protein
VRLKAYLEAASNSFELNIAVYASLKVYMHASLS